MVTDIMATEIKSMEVKGSEVTMRVMGVDSGVSQGTVIKDLEGVQALVDQVSYRFYKIIWNECGMPKIRKSVNNFNVKRML